MMWTYRYMYVYVGNKEEIRNQRLKMNNTPLLFSSLVEPQTLFSLLNALLRWVLNMTHALASRLEVL